MKKPFSFELVDLDGKTVLTCSVGFETRNDALTAGKAVVQALRNPEFSPVVILAETRP